jgi:hypothetical protein
VKTQNLKTKREAAAQIWMSLPTRQAAQIRVKKTVVIQDLVFQKQKAA